jgi:hypothetical protein
MQTVQFTEAVRGMSRLASEVEHGRPFVIERRGSRFVLCSVEELESALRCCYRFDPEVFFDDDDSVAIWLPELDVHGEGSTLEEAQADLVDVVCEYVEAWQESLRHAPNHAGRRGWVRRLQLAEGEDGVRAVLFGE